jgi:hypothetical protein
MFSKRAVTRICPTSFESKEEEVNVEVVLD